MNRIFNYVFMASQERLHRFLISFLTRYYSYEDTLYTDEFILAKGNIPVTLIAHLDTVHKRSNQGCLYHDSKKNVVWSPNGLGADDRAGVYAIMEIVKKGYRPHIIFTHDEEIGGVGARELSKYNLPFETNFMIELDRRGYREAVFYQCGNKSFQKKILSYGFRLGYGSFSDISIISPAYDIASVNLGIGYYNEHSTDEYLKINEMYDTINKVISILKDESIDGVKYDYQKVSYAYNYNKNSRTATNYAEYYGRSYNQNLQVDDDSYWDAWYKKNAKNVVEKTIEEKVKKNEESVKPINERNIEDFDIEDVENWTQEEIDKYYDLLYNDNDDVLAWYAKYYQRKQGITEQGNEFNGDGFDIVSEDPQTVNDFLESEVQ
ncbi:MAG: hypothetical protein PHC62_06860 [Candidatus Izemoplasmatales bacterium]|nr:hypothetical protein [Candidatus Izemoplasmatales bacterium]